MSDIVESTKVIPAKPPVEILNNGNTLESESGNNLNDIFAKMEAGESLDSAIGSKREQPVVQQEAEVKEATPPPASDLDTKLGEISSAKDAEEEVSREKLLEATTPKVEKPKEEVKAEVKTEEKPAEKAAPVDPDAPTDEDLQVLPHDKPKTAKRIQALLKKVDAINSTYAETRRDVEAKAKRLSELEEQLKKVQSVDPTTTEAVKTQLDELRMYKRKYELDKDPEIKVKFDAKVEYAESGITDILTARQASPELLKLIAKEGGWTKFSGSQSPVAVRAADGTTTTITAAEASENILAALPILERKKIESAMMEQIQIERDKKRFLEEETKRASEFFSEREEQTKKQMESQSRAVEDAKKLIEDFKTTAINERDWLKQQQIPENATPQEKANIEDSNAYRKQLAQLLKKNLEVKDVPSMLGVVEDSVAYYAERRKTALLTQEVTKLRAELESRSKEMDKFKSASKSTARHGSIAGGGSSAPAATNKPKVPTSLEAAFDAIEKGEKLSALE